MRAMRVSTAALAAAAVGLTGCGGGGSAKDADKVVKDWITAGVEKDGEKFCDLMTTDFLEKSTGQQSNAAKKRCEDQVKSGSGNFAVKLNVGKARPGGETAAQVPVSGTVQPGTVKLRKENDKFKVDGIE